MKARVILPLFVFSILVLHLARGSQKVEMKRQLVTGGSSYHMDVVMEKYNELIGNRALTQTHLGSNENQHGNEEIKEGIGESAKQRSKEGNIMGGTGNVLTPASRESKEGMSFFGVSRNMMNSLEENDSIGLEVPLSLLSEVDKPKLLKISGRTIKKSRLVGSVGETKDEYSVVTINEFFFGNEVKAHSEPVSLILPSHLVSKIQRNDYFLISIGPFASKSSDNEKHLIIVKRPLELKSAAQCLLDLEDPLESFAELSFSRFANLSNNQKRKFLGEISKTQKKWSKNQKGDERENEGTNQREEERENEGEKKEKGNEGEESQREDQKANPKGKRDRPEPRMGSDSDSSDSNFKKINRIFSDIYDFFSDLAHEPPSFYSDIQELLSDVSQIFHPFSGPLTQESIQQFKKALTHEDESTFSTKAIWEGVPRISETFSELLINSIEKKEQSFYENKTKELQSNLKSKMEQTGISLRHAEIMVLGNEKLLSFFIASSSASPNRLTQNEENSLCELGINRYIPGILPEGLIFSDYDQEKSHWMDKNNAILKDESLEKLLGFWSTQKTIETKRIKEKLVSLLSRKSVEEVPGSIPTWTIIQSIGARSQKAIDAIPLDQIDLVTLNGLLLLSKEPTPLLIGHFNSKKAYFPLVLDRTLQATLKSLIGLNLQKKIPENGGILMIQDPNRKNFLQRNMVFTSHWTSLKSKPSVLLAFGEIQPDGLEILVADQNGTYSVFCLGELDNEKSKIASEAFDDLFLISEILTTQLAIFGKGSTITSTGFIGLFETKEISQGDQEGGEKSSRSGFLSNEIDSEFSTELLLEFAPVEVGSQLIPLDLLVDTGSNGMIFQFFGKKLKENQANSCSNSSAGTNALEKYKSGWICGCFSSASFQIGSTKFQNDFMMVSEASQSIEMELSGSGVIGLSLQSSFVSNGAQINSESLKEKNSKGFLETQENSPNSSLHLFSFYLGPDSSFLALENYSLANYAKKDAQIKWLSVSAYSGWAIDLLYQPNSPLDFTQEPWTILGMIDTGSAVILLPQNIIHSFEQQALSEFNASCLVSSLSGLLTCQMPDPKNIQMPSFVFWQRNQKIELKPKYFIGECFKANGVYCQTLIGASGVNGFAVFGIPFFKQFYTIFDTQNKTVGIVESIDSIVSIIVENKELLGLPSIYLVVFCVLAGVFLGIYSLVFENESKQPPVGEFFEMSGLQGKKIFRRKKKEQKYERIY